ncbi:MAG: tetratricopeptide repeat protein [Cognaticolwellia sp.]
MNIGKKILLSLVMIALLSLFFFTLEYREKIANAAITRHQLSLLETLDVFTTTEQRLTRLLKSENRRAWLHLATLYADTDADTAFALAEYFRDSNNLNTAKLWYQAAIRQQHVEARIALADIYYQQKNYAGIKPLLQPVLGNDEALVIAYKLAMRQGDLTFIADYQYQLAHGENKQFYQELQQYGVFGLSEGQRILQQSVDCPIDVQLFATNLAGLRHAQQLSLAFEHDVLAQHFCLRAPKYIPENALNCQHQADEKISCNASVWLGRKDIGTRYLGVIVEQGGANVDNGIMYLDQQDNIDVLVHELSHFIGFVDEYPLPNQHQKCQQVQQASFAHNLVVLADYYQGKRADVRAKVLSQVPWRHLIKASTPILSSHEKGWQLATPKTHQAEIGLFNAASCDKQANIQAFKPVANRTKLQYFELGLPKSYIDIMMLAPRRYLMPSYHYNMSRDIAKQGDSVKAREVLQVTQFD